LVKEFTKLPNNSIVFYASIAQVHCFHFAVKMAAGKWKSSWSHSTSSLPFPLKQQLFPKLSVDCLLYTCKCKNRKMNIWSLISLHRKTLSYQMRQNGIRNSRW
jgi:hypothetical protein